MDIMDGKNNRRSDGLYAVYAKNRVNATEEAKANRSLFGKYKATFGALGDSAYEYMLKTWLQGGRRETKYRDMYDRAVQGLHDELLHYSHPNGLAYVAERRLHNGQIDRKMDHLVCYLAGTLTLGSFTDPLGPDSERAARDLRTGRALAYTCYQMYARMRTGMAPEIVMFLDDPVDDEDGDDEEDGDYDYVDFYVKDDARFNILRPEAVESFYILHELTGDPAYREWGWEIFQSLERFCRTDAAYGGLGNVNRPDLGPEDRMESFFLAETLKYLYLLFDPESEVDVLKKVSWLSERASEMEDPTKPRRGSGPRPFSFRKRRQLGSSANIGGRGCGVKPGKDLPPRRPPPL